MIDIKSTIIYYCKIPDDCSSSGKPFDTIDDPIIMIATCKTDYIKTIPSRAKFAGE